MGHGHIARNHMFSGCKTIYYNNLVSSRSNRKVKGQSQEGNVKGSMSEWEGLGAAEK